MSSIVNGKTSALWMEHQFAARENSCRVFGELVFDEETSESPTLSEIVFPYIFYVPHNSQKDNVVDV